MSTPVEKRYIKIVRTDKFLKSMFSVEVDQVYEVVGHAKGEEKYGYLIYTQKGKAIVIFESECVRYPM